MLLSRRFPVLYPVSVAAHRSARHIRQLASLSPPVPQDGPIQTPFLVARHSSPIYRRLEGVDMQLQENKKRNLELAIPHLDGRIMGPGSELSFWRCVGPTTKHRGYLPGLLLAHGRMVVGVGGGLCQLSNLLYWLALHTPLAVTERHHHGYDPFPDSGRVLPFGSGATVFYNYIDLKLRNPTRFTFRLRLRLTAEDLVGEVWADRLPPLAYHVHEEGHRFVKEAEGWYRENRLYQVAVDRRTGLEAWSRLAAANRCPIMYDVPETVAQRAGVSPVA